jgi:tetratricopeptide (TPR) repeat protein
MRTFLIFCLSGLGCTGLTSCGRRPEVYIERAKSCYHQRKFEEAALDARKAIQADGRFGEAFYWLGLSEIELHHPRESYEALMVAVQLMPQPNEAKSKLADLVLQFYLADATRPARLRAQLTNLSDQLLAADPNNYSYLRIKSYLAFSDHRPEDAITWLERAGQAKPHQGETSLLLSQALMQAGRTAEAEQTARNFIDRQKTYGPIYDALYLLYRKDNRLVEAESVLRTKIANNPGQPQFVLQLAMHFADLQKSAEMKVVLGQIVRDAKTFPEGPLLVGDFCFRIGDYDEALKQYDAGEASGRSKSVYEKRRAAVLAARQKPDEAIRILDAILAEQPKDETNRAMRDTLLVASSQPEDVRKGIADLRALLEANPNDAALHYQLGQGLKRRGDWEAARSQLETVLQLRPSDRQALLAVMEIAGARHDYQAVLAYADRLLAIDPHDAVARLRKCAALVESGDKAEARAGLMRLIREDPGNQNAQLELAFLNMRDGRAFDSEAVFRKFYHPGQADLRPLTGLVELLETRKDYDQALQLLEEELAKSKQPLAIRSLIALTAIQAHKYNIAVEQYRESLKEKSSAPDLYIALGEAYQLNQDLPQAIASFRRARELAPLDSRPLLYLGNALQSDGKQDQALEIYRNLAKLSPNDPMVLNNLAFLISETGKHVDEALDIVAQALQRSPGNPAILDTLGTIYLRKNWGSKATELFSRLIQKSPDNALYHYHFGLALRQIGDKAKARTELRSALMHHPTPEVAQRISSLVGQL